MGSMGDMYSKHFDAPAPSHSHTRSIGSMTSSVFSAPSPFRIAFTTLGCIASLLPKNKYSSFGRYNVTGEKDSIDISPILLTFHM